MAKDAGKKSFLDFFKVKNIDDEEDEFDDDLFDDDDYDDDDDEDDEDYVKPSRQTKARASFGKAAEKPASSSKYEAAAQVSSRRTSAEYQNSRASSGNGKLVDFKDNQRQSYNRSSEFRSRSEVFVIKPQETDEAQSIIDFLRANKTIVINIEGLEVSVAQRIIDYVGGACYAMGGSLNVVSSNIFIATPQDIEVSGDLREELVSQDAMTPYVQY